VNVNGNIGYQFILYSLIVILLSWIFVKLLRFYFAQYLEIEDCLVIITIIIFIGFRYSHCIGKVIYELNKQEMIMRTIEKRPQRIILIRHGEHCGNVNKIHFETTPDSKIPLTEKGKSQSLTAGQEIRRIVGNESVHFFVSPYRRSKQTFKHIVNGGSFDKEKYIVTEDPRLREQDWGNFQDPKMLDKYMRERRDFGHFYYRLPNGESAADVFDRVSDFLSSLHRIWKYNEHYNNFVIVSHGITIRLLLMRYFRWTVEDFHRLWNFENCQICILEIQENGSYALKTPLKRNPTCEEKLSEKNLIK